MDIAPFGGGGGEVNNIDIYQFDCYLHFCSSFCISLLTIPLWEHTHRQIDTCDNIAYVLLDEVFPFLVDFICLSLPNFSERLVTSILLQYRSKNMESSWHDYLNTDKDSHSFQLRYDRRVLTCASHGSDIFRLVYYKNSTV